MFERGFGPERRERLDETMKRLRRLAREGATASRRALDALGAVALPIVRDAAWSIPGSVEELALSAHVVAAGATAGACAVADVFVAPGAGAAIELAGGAVVAGVAVSAVYACMRRSGVTGLPTRAVVAAVASEVHGAHEGLFAARALHGLSSLAVGAAGPAACLPAATHLARATALRFVASPLGRVPVMGVAVQLADGARAAVKSARFVRDVERSAERIAAFHAGAPRLFA